MVLIIAMSESTDNILDTGSPVQLDNMPLVRVTPSIPQVGTHDYP